MIAAALCAGVAVGCRVRERTADTATDDGGVNLPLRVAPGDDVVLEYADLGGRFRRARGIGTVPLPSRLVVRVIPPTASETRSGDDVSVQVVDLNRPDADGRFTAARMRRIDFEARALAALPPGRASRIAVRGVAGVFGGVHVRPTVTVYGTGWCAACRDTRAYLDRRSIDYRFVDVEKDPARAEEMARVLARVGVGADRVPVIDVYGRVLVGFRRAPSGRAPGRLLMKRLVMVCAALGALAAPARADILTLHATAQAGGALGRGISGDAKDAAFHDGASGATYGAEVGVEILFVDGWIEHFQYAGSGGLLGTWTQFMVGVDLKMHFGSQRGGHLEKGKRVGDAYQVGYAEMGIGAGFGVGTGQQVMPPLDNAQVTDKGFLVQGSFALGYRLNRVISINLRVPVQAGYMFKNGIANDSGNQYTSVQGALLAGLRFEFQLK